MSDTSIENFSPQAALDRLIEGNKRFISGVRSIDTLASHLKMAELAEKGQRPFAVVLTCSDSRSPVEMIFDQGLGEIFVIRVAGNVVAPSLLASIEFAAANFASSLILVMGHTRCGAVTAAYNHVLDPGVPLASPHLEELISRIRPAVEQMQKKVPNPGPDFLEQCVVENVKRSMRLIRDQSAIVRDLVNAGKIAIEGSILDISTGKVRFFK